MHIYSHHGGSDISGSNASNDIDKKKDNLKICPKHALLSSVCSAECNGYPFCLFFNRKLCHSNRRSCGSITACIFQSFITYRSSGSKCHRLYRGIYSKFNLTSKKHMTNSAFKKADALYQKVSNIRLFYLII